MHKFASAAFLAAALFASAAAAEPLSKDAVVQDLTYFRDVWLPKDQSFTPQDRARFTSYVNDEIAHARPMERTGLALIFLRGEAMSGNGHSQSEYVTQEGLFHTLPISFWLFPEGAIVTRAHPQFRKLLGARIVSIGGVPFEEAKRRVADYITGTAERHRYLTPSFLTRLEVLQAAGLANDGAASFDFVLPSGEKLTERLGPTPSPDPAAGSATWRASLVPGKGPDPWPHVLDSLKELPPFVQKPDEFILAKAGDGSVAYIRSTSLSPYEGEIAVQAKAYGIMDDLVTPGHRPKDIVVDLRYNGGGNLFNIISFAKELTGLLPSDGRLYVITGRATFSAAIVFAALLKDEAQGRAVIVGEEVSDNLRFWSEGANLTAPASKLPLHYTTGLHDWARGCRDLDRCYWPVVFHGVAVGNLKPDIPVEMTFAQYAAGDDAAMDAVLADVAKRRRTRR